MVIVAKATSQKTPYKAAIIAAPPTTNKHAIRHANAAAGASDVILSLLLSDRSLPLILERNLPIRRNIFDPVFPTIFITRRDIAIVTIDTGTRKHLRNRNPTKILCQKYGHKEYPVGTFFVHKAFE